MPSQDMPEEQDFEPGSDHSSVFNLLLKYHGIDFAYYRQTTIGRRIERRAKLKDAASPEEYIGMLEGIAGNWTCFTKIC